MDIFKNYDKDDIINELFTYTDALRDQEPLDPREEEMLDALRARYYDLCEGKS